MESREPVDGFLVSGLEGLLAALRSLLARYPDKKAATLGMRGTILPVCKLHARFRAVQCRCH